jgi:hypothetical protein
VPVSDVDRSEDVNGTPPNENGVLANLPRARPQRSSARRQAARETNGSRNGASTAVREQRAPTRRPSTAAAKGARKRAQSGASSAAKPPVAAVEQPVSAKPKSSTASAAGKAATPKAAGRKRPAAARATRKRARPTAVQDPAPRQGFESESETPSGSVQPPGGVELVASAAELVGELAKAGLSRSERLLKDVVSRLPLS